jgi:hypothetical protein
VRKRGQVTKNLAQVTLLKPMLIHEESQYFNRGSFGERVAFRLVALDQERQKVDRFDLSLAGLILGGELEERLAVAGEFRLRPDDARCSLRDLRRQRS